MTRKRWICLGLAVCVLCALGACREPAPPVETLPVSTAPETTAEETTEALPGFAVMREFPLGMSEGSLLTRLSELEIILFSLADGNHQRALTEGFYLACAGIQFYFDEAQELIACEVTGVNYYTDTQLRTGSTKAEVQTIYPAMRELPNGEVQETLAIGHLTFRFGPDDTLKSWAWTKQAWEGMPAEQFTTTAPPTTTEEPTTTEAITTTLPPTTTFTTYITTTLPSSSAALWENRYFDPAQEQQYRSAEGLLLSLQVTQLSSGTDYALYELKMQDAPLSLGYFYVDSQRVIRLNAPSQPIAEGSVVCQENPIPDPLAADVPGQHASLTSQSGTVTYHSYDSSGSNGLYETFVWVSERGLVYYACGYGNALAFSAARV